jgi:hypothetical protein
VRAGLATLRMDLLTEAEEPVDRKTGHLRVDIRLPADGSAQLAGWGDPALSKVRRAAQDPEQAS